MSNERFIKFMPSEEADFLLENHPNAFLLLCLIARRARRTNGQIDGLIIGDAQVGDHEKSGLTRKQYRTALEKLVELGFIEVVIKSRNSQECKKRAIKRAIRGTLVNLKDSRIWDINPEIGAIKSANEGPSRGHEQERTRKNKNIKETTTPKPPNLTTSDNITSVPSIRGLKFEVIDDAVVVVGFYKCLENIDLTIDEKQSLMNFTEERVSKAIAFANHPEVRIKTSLIRTLVWHCQKPSPPEPPAVNLTEQQKLSLRFNDELLKLGYRKLYEENVQMISEGKHAKIICSGKETTTALNNTLASLKDDFNECLEELAYLKNSKIINII